MRSEVVLFAGTANPALAAATAEALGVPVGACRVERFPDGELSVRLDASVRGHEVFVVQPTAPPVNDHLVELLAFADACRRAAAQRVTAVVPYFGYARADRRNCRREPITASLVAALMEAAGIDHVITLDLHTSQIEGFFHVPVDSLTAVPALCDALRERLPPDALGSAVVVAPDSGRVPMATEYATRLGLPLVVLHKRRASGSVTAVTHLVGDVRGRTCVLIDDMIATGGTLVESVRALRTAGARPGCVVAATHGLLLGDALDRLRAAGCRELFVTDTVARAAGAADGADAAGAAGAAGALHVVPVGPLLALAIRRQLEDGSLAELRR